MKKKLYELSRWLSLFPSSNPFFFHNFFFNVKSWRHKKRWWWRNWRNHFVCVIIFLGGREVQWFDEITKEANGLEKEVANSLGEGGCVVSDITYRVPLKRWVACVSIDYRVAMATVLTVGLSCDCGRLCDCWQKWREMMRVIVSNRPGRGPRYAPGRHGWRACTLLFRAALFKPHVTCFMGRALYI